ncbi:MAG: DsbA family protein [Candidatus Sungbacteria bacterium]|nr:DsbA family protein [Candidatus Sungbacteria bacterium]
MDDIESQNEVKTDDKKENTFLIPASIIVAGVLIAFAVFYSGRGGNMAPSRQPSAANNTAPAAPVISGDLADDDPTLGNPDAPVTMVEFSDFQCPFCRSMWRNILPQIKENYIKTGKVKFVYRDFPLTSIHPGAEPAALAGECADEQGKFWTFHDKVFEEQDKKGQGTVEFGAADLKQWARAAGLDGVQFDSCLGSRKYADEVAKDLQDGVAAGVTGTPATFVNGRLISGALPYAQFEAIIEEAFKR